MATIRPAESSDVPAILELWREADAEPTHTDDPVSLNRLIEHDPGATLVAESQGLIVGSVIAAWDGWRGSIYRLAVSPGHRRRGLGKHLVREATNRLSSVGAIRIQAIVVETDARAVAFWRANGWEQQVHRLRFVTG